MVILAALWGRSAAGAEPPDPRPIFQDIESAPSHVQGRDPQAVPRLHRDVEALSGIIAEPARTADQVIVAHYYRALARTYISEFDHRLSGAPFDREAVREAVAELEGVVTAINARPGEGGEDWTAVKANALYVSGSATYEQLGDQPKSYIYWTACAALDHAGCLNIMANAYTTGDGGVTVDLTEALRLHKRVFETATRFGCAGVFSARSVAVLVALGGVKNTKENAQIWIENASNLLHVIEADRPGTVQCGRFDIDFTAYLIGLMHGARRPEILDRVIAQDSQDAGADIAGYLKGRMDAASFQLKLDSYPEAVRCDAAFYALWAADIAHDTPLARRYAGSLAASPVELCRVDYAYARAMKSLQ